MKPFADTSFLCALYRIQSNTPAALTVAETLTTPLFVSELVLYEVRQSVQLQNYNFHHDRTKGFPVAETKKLLEQLDANLRGGALKIEDANWSQVFKFAELLSEHYTADGGYRAMDILHIATALHVKATHLYTFDDHQARLAEKAGLKTN